MAGGNTLLTTSCWALSGSFRRNWELTVISNTVLWLFVALILENTDGRQFWCTEQTQGLREEWDCPGAPCPVQADLVLEVLLQYCEQQWECALCSTQVGWCLVTVLSWLWVSWSLSQESGWACALCWSGLEWPPSSGEVTQPQGCGQCICTWLAAQGLQLHTTGFVAVLGISSSYSPFPWSPYRLNPC